MVGKIRIGIVGYGNLGKGAELAISQNPDMELVAVFSRRRLEGSASGAPFVPFDEIEKYAGKVDVMILCGGSATELLEQGPLVAQWFNTVNSFDTHAKIPEHFEQMDAVAKAAGTAALISVGWDPGLFSLMRLLGNSVLPAGTDNTFWGAGVSQGHSDAIRRIPGVKQAKQYTIPKEKYIQAVRSGQAVNLPGNELHLRDCYVVPESGADLAAIETAIKEMPNYFVGYETTVSFISEEDYNSKHSGIPHGGFVFRNGETQTGVRQRMEFAVQLDSNPEFTASILVAYARAVCRLSRHGGKGAYTVFDIPFGWLSVKSASELRKEML